MAGIETLLAKFKALFEPTKQPSSSADVEEAPALAAVTEMPEPTSSGPVGAAQEAPSVEPAAEVVATFTTEPLADETSFTSPEPADAEAIISQGEAPTAAAAPSGLTLRLESERGTPSTFEVTKSGATLGRGPENTICLADLSVSRKHARIAYRQGVYWLSDLGSMGGTWVDGTKLAAPRRVATGQRIDIGVCRLSVITAGAEEESPAAKRPSEAAIRSSR